MQHRTPPVVATALKVGDGPTNARPRTLHGGCAACPAEIRGSARKARRATDAGPARGTLSGLMTDKEEPGFRTRGRKPTCWWLWALGGSLALYATIVTVWLAWHYPGEVYRMTISRTASACEMGLDVGATDCGSFVPDRLVFPANGYGRPFRCEMQEGAPVVVSFGRDGRPGGTGLDGDVTCKLIVAGKRNCRCDLPDGI